VLHKTKREHEEKSRHEEDAGALTDASWPKGLMAVGKKSQLAWSTVAYRSGANADASKLRCLTDQPARTLHGYL